MFRVAGMMALLILSGGCTVQRIHRDANAGLDYLRLNNGTQVDATSRWQFASDTRIAVKEVSPAAHDDWLTSAREGMGSVFGLLVAGVDEPPGMASDLDLLIAWPGDRLEGTDNAGYFRYLRIDKMVQGSDPMSLRVFLCDAQTRTLIQSATLNLSPRWFSRDGANGEHIRKAFREYAAGLVSRY